jgi:hypothetical protein
MFHIALDSLNEPRMDSSMFRMADYQVGGYVTYRISTSV